MRSTVAQGGLHDELAGIVTRHAIVELPSWAPPGLRSCMARLCRPHPTAQAPLRSSSGCTWWDADAAIGAAVGEAVEWYAASLVREGLERASLVDVQAARFPHVDPRRLALHSAGQLATPGFPFIGFPEDLSVHWTRGRTLANEQERLVPASVVYLGYGTGPTHGEAPTNLPTNAGVAAARSWTASVAAGLQEVIERDALAGAWTFGLPLEPLSPPEWFRIMLGGDEATQWTFHRLPTVVDVPGVLAVIRHAGTRVIGVGAAVRAEPVAAAAKAAAEAAVSARSALELDRADLPTVAQLVAAGVMAPWRADRTYARAYRADWRDVTCLPCHLQLYLDSTMQDRLDTRLAVLNAGQAPRPLESLPCGPGEDPDGWVALLVDAGYDPVVVDVTTSDVAALGWSVTRCVVAGLRSTAPAAFPFLGAVADPARRGRGPAHLDPVPHA